jgi:hypothetical protein
VVVSSYRVGGNGNISPASNEASDAESERSSPQVVKSSSRAETRSTSESDSESGECRLLGDRTRGRLWIGRAGASIIDIGVGELTSGVYSVPEPVIRLRARGGGRRGRNVPALTAAASVGTETGVDLGERVRGVV